MYDMLPLQAPRVTGWRLAALSAMLESPLTGPWLAEHLFGRVGLEQLRLKPLTNDLPVLHPLLAAYPATAPAPHPPTLQAVPAPAGFPAATIADLARAYREGAATPVTVAEAFLANLERLDRQEPRHALFIAQRPEDLRAQALASAERFGAGRPLGPLDGVPIAIKDELDQAGYPTTAGTRFLGATPATEDAEVVRRLREAGALLVGKTNMHEIGMGASGHNAHHGPARNPYHPERATGGSSSGSAAAVAAGLCPAAIGTDGGGSIRIPAALCGLVGLKPTFGRVSGRGATLSCWSVAHVGPLAASAADAALLYQAIAGPDPADPTTWHQPPPTLAAGDLRGLKLGVFRPWFEDAAEPVVQACSALLARLVGRGAEVVEINLPYLGTCAVAHMVTIATEMAAAHARGFERDSRAYGPEVRFNLALARRLRATDYVQAQRVRALVLEGFLDALRRVDAIVSPAVACLAPALVCAGESDLVQLDQLMRFARPANLTGLPAISFPAGYDADGLPIGLQAIGKPWDEATLLAIARAAEAVVPRRAPAAYRPLTG